MARRSYKQSCALALALDRVGERWTLLLVREFLTGPKRFKDLLANLPGIGTNLLSARLRELEENRLVRRMVLPPPAGSPAYELTEFGRQLEPAVVALAQWGLRYLGPPRKGMFYRPSWAIVAMKATFNREAAKGTPETYEFRIDEEVFHARVEAGKVYSAQGPAWKPDLIVTTDTHTFERLVIGRLDAPTALRRGLVKIEGNSQALVRAGKIFGITHRTGARVPKLWRSNRSC